MGWTRVGVPEEAVAWGAIALAGPAAWAAAKWCGSDRRRKIGLWVIAGIAALLSIGYAWHYLRGGPRIIDASSYFLEARALSEGHVRWPTGPVPNAVLGRFLVRSEGPEGAHAAVVFPPGYPTLLAVGMRLGAPMLVGPMLAMVLVFATYSLGRALGGERVGRLAGVLSVTCAALRYHTADTMSHGHAAMCFAVGLVAALAAIAEPRPSRSIKLALISGFFGGWLAASRPASGLAWGVTVAIAVALADAVRREAGFASGEPMGASVGDRARWMGTIALGALPGIAWLVIYNRVATGSWGVATHTAYYAQNDGPPGCFRYGFGAGIGCAGEHGDFVSANLRDGFGAIAALKTTGRRLWMHLVDGGNAEPLALVTLAGVWIARRRAVGRVLIAAILAQIAAYAPFYFDGNYPGGGARLYADVLPIEHALLALAAVEIGAEGSAGRAPGDGGAARRWFGGADRRTGALVALALLGFGVRASFDHGQLGARDGGHPLFEEKDLAQTGLSGGLLFIDSDHGHGLSFDPDRWIEAIHRGSVRADAWVVARYKGDGSDALVWEALGRPPAFRHEFAGYPAVSRVLPYAPSRGGGGTLRIEGASVWPPAEQRGGAFVGIDFAGGTCAAPSRWLAMRVGPVAAGDAGPARVRIELPWIQGDAGTVDLAMVGSGGGGGRLRLRVDGGAGPWIDWAASEAETFQCQIIRVGAIGETGSVIAVEFRPNEGGSRGAWGLNHILVTTPNRD